MFNTNLLVSRNGSVGGERWILWERVQNHSSSLLHPLRRWLALLVNNLTYWFFFSMIYVLSNLVFCRFPRGCDGSRHVQDVIYYIYPISQDVYTTLDRTY